MNLMKSAAVAVALGFCCIAYSADVPKEQKEQKEQKEAGVVTINSPAEGAKVGLSGIKVAFEVTAAPKGDHVHVFVDGEQVSELRQLKGSYTVDKLTAGRHWVCFRVVDKAHTPVGAEKCVTLNAGNVPSMGY